MSLTWQSFKMISSNSLSHGRSTRTSADLSTPASDVLARIIDEIVTNPGHRLQLEELAEHAGYDPTHFHKIFKAHVGITPKQFLSYLTLRTARDLLSSGVSVTDTSGLLDLSSSARLYDLFTINEAILPRDVQQRGAGMVIHYGWHPTCLGDLLIAETSRGICYMGFRADQASPDATTRLARYFPAATMIPDSEQTARTASLVNARWLGHTSHPVPLPLDIHGSNFQLMVWRALLRIPVGCTVSYQDVARAIGRPRAARAVGTAVGSNPISLLIPCHRVIQQSGIIENYGWGSDRKRAVLGIESCLRGSK